MRGTQRSDRPKTYLMMAKGACKTGPRNTASPSYSGPALGRHPGLRQRFAPRPRLTRRGGAGVLMRAATLCAAYSPWKWLDLPSSRENPCRRAHAPSTPEDSDGTCLVALVRRGHGEGNVRGFFDWTFEAQSHGSTTRCLRFAAAVTRRHARLASGCAATPCRAGLAPAGSPMKDFSYVSVSHIVLLSRACLTQSAFLF